SRGWQSPSPARREGATKKYRDSSQHLQSIHHRIHHTGSRRGRETPCRRDKGVISRHQHLDAAVLCTREMQCIQVAQAMQAQDDGALHGGLINGHTLSGTRTQGQDCYGPILRWTLVDLVQQCIGSDPEKFTFLYGTQQMFGGFGLKSDTCLTLVVK